jgi:glycerol-3-phosphate dehydrogenase (NAD(P)+)
MRIAIAGAGAFGTALAVALVRNGTPVTLWARDPQAAAQIVACRENAARLPGIRLPQEIDVVADIGAVFAADIVLLSLPAQQLRGFLETHRAGLSGKALVACSKGIDLATLTGPTGTIEAAVPDAIAAALTGPSFAADIARGLPTALTLACRDDGDGAKLQDALSTASLRLYRTTDTIGAELGGALKNVMAIACGACIGAGLGDSARAALMTRGFAEMQRLAARLGADPDTLTGLSGLGDLALTCTSDLSRNYRFGLALGRQTPFDTSTTVEGAATAKAVSHLGRLQDIDLPISAVVADLVDRRINVETAMQTLLSRPLKEE